MSCTVNALKQVKQCQSELWCNVSSQVSSVTSPLCAVMMGRRKQQRKVIQTHIIPAEEDFCLVMSLSARV